jgi:hypothetical protein
MASISDYVLDAALSKLDTEANAIHITSQEAATYTEATSTYSLGSATTISIGTPQNRTASGGGREVVLANVTGGNVSAGGSADTFAIVDTTNSRLLATGALATSQTVASGNTFTLTGISIGIPDPT